MPSLYLLKAKKSVLLQKKSTQINTRFKRETWEGRSRLDLTPSWTYQKSNIRWLPIISTLFAFVALVLAFLCLFAGSRPNYMDNYYILSFNTSSIGINLLKKLPSSSKDTRTTQPNNPFSTLINPLLNGMQSDFNYVATTIAKKLGLMDFYSIHMMDYCFGRYKPEQNIPGCSTRTVLFAFDPLPILQKALDRAGIGISVESLNWPRALQDGIAQLKLIAHVAFTMYGISITFCFLTMTSCIYWMSPNSQGSRRIVAVALTLSSAAFGTLLFASLLLTVLIDKGEGLVGKYGKPMGITVNRGNGYLGLTWAATLLAFAGMVAIGSECCRRRNRKAFKVFFEK